jgi:hypothetical protein
MRNLIVIFILSIFLFSCKKNNDKGYLLPDNEIPGWLKTQITKDEQKIQDSPQYMTSYGAWLRYNWQNVYYFEYHNPVSSSSPIPISFNGDTLHIFANDINTDYCKEKCCNVYVWKAPRFMDF